jgi:hypothetical protein
MSSSTDLIPLKNNLKNLSDVATLKQMVCCKNTIYPEFSNFKRRC